MPFLYGMVVKRSRMKEIMENIGVISFTSVDEIYNMKDKAREVYANLSMDAKEVYKWYFYKQLCLLSTRKSNLKDYMWLYICGKPIENKLEEEYEKFCNKRAKILY